MSKKKFSFSLILALFLVGILSTSAFAKDPYSLKPVQSGLDLKVPFTGNSADAADIAGREFDLILKDGATIVKTYGPVALAADKKGTFTILATDITPGKAYSVELFHTDDAGHATLLSKSSALVTDAHNTLSTQVVDKDGNGLQNANQTGYNNTRKQRSGQKVHGFYQNNTNSCASCHQTHTGNDTNLLFKNGTYSTCAACHDGTMGAYGVWNPITEENVSSISGSFNTQAGHNGSLHEADGTLRVSAAPGGNRTAPDTNKQWGQEFDCASCHAPHGNGSASENNLNLDPLGWGSVAYSTTDNDTKNGKQFKDIPIYASKAAIPAGEKSPYVLVRINLPDQAAVDANYFYKRASVPAGSDVLQTYRFNNGKGWVPDYSLWLREKGYPYTANSVLYKDLWTNLVFDSTKTDKTKDISNSPNKDTTDKVTFVWRDGFAFGPGVVNVQSAQISIGVDVETTNDIASLFDSSKTGVYIPDSGVQMSKYCSACHTDYLSATHADATTGLYTSAYRHQTASDSLTCVRCHFGHGSEAQIMKDANDSSYYDLTKAGAKFDGDTTGAINYLLDPNPSSALKRYTGMSVCFACHGGGEQFLGNANNGTGAQALTGKLKAGQPGTARSDY